MSDKKIGGLPSDGKAKGEYSSAYPPDIIKGQWIEALYILMLMIIAIASIIVAFLIDQFGWLNLPQDKLSVAINTIYCMSAGLLGGATFDMKCLYRAVSTGMWHKDRVFWRVFSPFVSIALALVMGAIFSDQLISSTGFSAISIGFFSGYFSDEAVGKMYDVALVLFSRGDAVKEKDKSIDNFNENEEKDESK